MQTRGTTNSFKCCLPLWTCYGNLFTHIANVRQKSTTHVIIVYRICPYITLALIRICWAISCAAWAILQHLLATSKRGADPLQWRCHIHCQPIFTSPRPFLRLHLADGTDSTEYEDLLLQLYKGKGRSSVVTYLLSKDAVRRKQPECFAKHGNGVTKNNINDTGASRSHCIPQTITQKHELSFKQLLTQKECNHILQHMAQRKQKNGNCLHKWYRGEPQLLIYSWNSPW